jgi:sugar lactone lactonase YvrE
MDIAFGPDGTLYVLEIAHESLLAAGEEAPPQGGLWSVPAGGGDPELITSEGLLMPGGIAVSDDGTIYVSTCTVCPGAGGIVSITP